MPASNDTINRRRIASMERQRLSDDVISDAFAVVIRKEQQKWELIDAIDAYPDFHELLSEATAEPYPVHGKERHQYVQVRVSGIREAILTGDDAEAGKLLRELVVAQVKEWQS